MTQAPLIVCERTGQWAAAWRQAWQRAATGGEVAKIRVLETRNPAECLETLAAWPASFLIVELDAAACDRSLELIWQILLRDRRAIVAVAAERRLAEYEWLVRELGAACFATSPRELTPLCHMVARYAALRPAQGGDEAPSVWDRLPWDGE